MPRKHAKPRSPANHPTPGQLHAQSETAILSAAWNALREEQRQRWCATARESRRGGTSKLGRRITGRKLFFRANSRRMTLELPLLTDPPDVGSFVEAPLVKLVFPNAAGRISLKLKVSGGEPKGVIVSSWYPVSPGTMSWSKFVRIAPWRFRFGA